MPGIEAMGHLLECDHTDVLRQDGVHRLPQYIQLPSLGTEADNLRSGRQSIMDTAVQEMLTYSCLGQSTTRQRQYC